MPDREFKIMFTADTSMALAGMQKLGAEFKGLESYINGTGSGLGHMGDKLSDLSTRVNVASDSMARMGGSARSMTTDVLAMGAGFLVIEAGVQVVASFGDIATKARDRIKELAIETMELRDKMRELANLKKFEGGPDDPDNTIAGETVKMAVKAGMMPEQMVKYLEQFEGSIPAGEQKHHIDHIAKEKLAVEGAKFGQRMKLDPRTAGDLAGVIPQYTNLKKNEQGELDDKFLVNDLDTPQVERAMKIMARVSHGLNEGRGNLEPLTRSLINTAGAVVGMGGPIEDLGDLAALQGVASTHANPKESGTRVRQAVRALRDTKGESGLFLTKTAGIKDTDDHITRLEKVKVQVEKAKAKGKAADTYLRDNGFNNEDEMRAVLEQVEDLDIIKKRIKVGREKFDGKKIIEDSEKFQTKTRVGIRQKQNATKAAQEFLLGESNERVEMAKENAEQRMREDGKIDGWWNNALELVNDFGTARQKLGFESSREKAKYGEAESNLIEEAKRVGIPEDKAHKVLGHVRKGNAKAGEFYWDGGHQDERVRTGNFNKLADMVERKDVNPMGSPPDLSKKLDKLISVGIETNQILAEKRQGPAPVDPRDKAGAPPIPRMRDAAAPKRP